VIVRDQCAGCGHKLETVLDLGATPLANHYPLPGEPDGLAYPLELAVCQVCWLAQLRHVVEPEEIFGDGYRFATASPAAAAYFGEAALWCLQRNANPAFTVDVGCNDGTLLDRFAGPGYQERVLGIDPSPAAETAQAKGLPVLREAFTAKTAQVIEAEHGKADLITAFHVVAHVPDPDDFMAGIATLLAADGTAVVEFQYLGDLVAGCMFDLVYHEHRFFFSLDSFFLIAAAHGLAIREVTRTPAQGGSLRVVLRHGWTAEDRVTGWRRREAWLRKPEAWNGLQDRADYARQRIREVVAAEKAEGRTVAGYAASAKACTLLNWCDFGPLDLPYVTDTTPGKTGRHIPGARIPIRPEGDLPHTYLLLASNHLPTVLRRISPAWRELGGRIITPLPLPAVT
jgi:methylation protein EvaC